MQICETCLIILLAEEATEKYNEKKKKPEFQCMYGDCKEILPNQKLLDKHVKTHFGKN